MASQNHEEQITYIAETDARGRRRRFGIKAKDRTRHVYVIGKTGMGKSTLLENMAVQDIRNGEGFAFIDPHGSTADKFLDYIPPERVDDVLYFAPFDMDYPISFNIMEDVGYDKRHLVVSGLMSAFKKIWADQWSSRMEYILSNTLLALLEYPETTLLDVNRMLVDKKFRDKVVASVGDPLVKAFWEEEFAKYTDRYTQEATPAIQNKIGQFTSNPLIRNIVGQPHSTFDLRKIIDERKIIIANLSKGQMGEGNANLLGSMLITKLYLAAMSRADSSDAELAKLPNFYFYVDEFQSFANESFADILSEARKYKLNLTIAHQYIEQMSEEVRSAVFGNVGTMITFRVGAFDAEVLEKEFMPKFTAQDLVNLGFAQVYLKLMIDGVSSQPFSAETLPPIQPPETSGRDVVIARSREMFARKRGEVEENIKSRGVEHMIPEGEAGNQKKANQEKAGEKPKKPQQQSQPQPKQPKPNKQHKPFADAFKNTPPQDTNNSSSKHEAAKAPVQQKSVPLAELKPKKEENKNDRGPSEKNRNQLRDALTAVMGNAAEDKINEEETETTPPEKKETVAQPRPTPKESKEPKKSEAGSGAHAGEASTKDNRPESASTNTIEDSKPKAKNEVPKDVLQQMLSVEDDEKQV